MKLITIRQTQTYSSITIDGDPIAYHIGGAISALWIARHLIARRGGSPLAMLKSIILAEDDTSQFDLSFWV